MNTFRYSCPVVRFDWFKATERDHGIFSVTRAREPRRPLIKGKGRRPIHAPTQTRDSHFTLGSGAPRELELSSAILSMSARAMTSAPLSDWQLRRQRELAFSMGQHERLGNASLLQTLSPELSRSLAETAITSRTLNVKYDRKKSKQTFIDPTDPTHIGNIEWDDNKHFFVLHRWSLAEEPPKLTATLDLVTEERFEGHESWKSAQVHFLESPVPLIVVFWFPPNKSCVWYAYRVPTLSDLPNRRYLGAVKTRKFPNGVDQLLITSGFNKLYYVQKKRENPGWRYSIGTLFFFVRPDDTLGWAESVVAGHPRPGIDSPQPADALLEPDYQSHITAMAASEHSLVVVQEFFYNNDPVHPNVRNIWVRSLTQNATWVLVAAFKTSIVLEQTLGHEFWVRLDDIACTKDFFHAEPGHGYLYMNVLVGIEDRTEQSLLQCSVPAVQAGAAAPNQSFIFKRMREDPFERKTIQNILAVADNNHVIVRDEKGDVRVIDVDNHFEFTLFDSMRTFLTNLAENLLVYDPDAEAVEWEYDDMDDWY